MESVGKSQVAWETEVTDVIRLKMKTPWEQRVLLLTLKCDITQRIMPMPSSK